MINLPITSESPKTALFFGFMSIITGGLLILMTGEMSVPQFVLVILGIFWIITGLIALWFGWKYLQMRQ